MSQNALVLGKLKLQPVDPAELATFKTMMAEVTLPKIRADVQRRRRAVAVTRQYVSR